MEWNLPLQWTFLSLTLGFSCKNFGHSAIWRTWQVCRVILPNWSYSITPFSKWWFCLQLFCIASMILLDYILTYHPSLAEFQRKAHYYLHTFVFSSSISQIALLRGLSTFFYNFFSFVFSAWCLWEALSP